MLILHTFLRTQILLLRTDLRTSMSDVIDIGKYPDGTDKVLVAIDKNTVTSYEYGFTTYSNIAEITGLSKDQVRYRVELLHENGHLRCERGDDWRQNAPTQIWIKNEPKSWVRDQMDYHEVVGSFPDTPTQEDLAEIVDYIHDLEKKINDLEKKMQMY